LKINKGIIYNKKGRAVAYKILGNAKDGSLDFTVSARDLIHVFDPVYSDQSRGVPLVSHGINQLRDATEAEKRELFAMVINSSIALIESNESGSNENALQGVYGNAAQAGTGMETSWMEDGMIKYFKAGSGGKLETMNSQRPGPNWESFQSRVYESVLAGMGWPKSMVANSDNTGPVERAQLAKAEKAVEDRQSLVKPLAKKIVTYVISKAVEREDLNFNAEWYKWDFTLPRKISIDLGRESAARINEYNEGFTTLAHVVGENGEQLESHIDQRIYEKVLIAQKIKKANEENGVEITWKD
jgi:capsid protein